MRLLSCMLLICAGLIAADPPKPQPKAPALLKVPPEAVQISPGLYRFTDKDGKVWLYRKTPFGVSRWLDDGQNAAQDSVSKQITATDAGDSVRFERVSPFGKTTWTKKKTELDENEKKIWERDQAKTAANRKAEKE